MGNRWILCALALMIGTAEAEQNVWQLEKPSFWARNEKAAKFSTANGVFSIQTKPGSQDWALSGIPEQPVKYLEKWVFSCEARGKAEGSAELSYVTKDSQSKVVSWIFTPLELGLGPEWKSYSRAILVPKGIAKIQPRLTGTAAADFEVRKVQLERTAEASSLVQTGKQTLGAAEFRYGTDGFSFAVNGQESDTDGSWLVLSCAVQGNTAVLQLLSTLNCCEYTATFVWQGQELCATLDGTGPLKGTLAFPPAFKTAQGQRLILPENEGMGYPVDEQDLPLEHFTPYFGTGHGLCMAFFGCADDASGRGWMGIVETQDDAFVRTSRGENGLWTASPVWGAQKKQFGYPRRVRYAFFDRGGYVAIAKRYRAYAKSIGRLKTFSEKVKERPAIDLLLGAANIWYFGGKKVEMAQELQRHGLGRILWSANGSEGEIAAMNAMTNVLSSRYDIYSDVMNPANFPFITEHSPSWPTEAYPNDITWEAPNGTMRRAWGIPTKAGTGMVYCVSLCDAKSYLYARKRIGDELKTKPFRCRFIDTATACAWQECWCPAHPMTRTDSKNFRIKLLNVVSGENGLVCGSETGLDAVVPVCDYFEGMLSIGRFRVPDAGRKMMELWEDPPENVAKFQLGERYRLPLWELVYHDCVVAQWYWGDYNNKLPSLWAKRDLFNALYGTPPMYMFDAKRWHELTDAFAKSYAVAEPVSRLTAYAEMTTHEILSPDRSVQRSVFSNGVVVTVNFGSKPFSLPGGAEIAPMTSRISTENVSR